MSDPNPNPNNQPYRPYSADYYIRSTAQLGVMAAVLCLSLDLGYAQAQHYMLQSTANMAAFIGAQQLPNADNAVQSASTYLKSEGVLEPAGHVQVVGDALVAVELEESYQTMFAKWLGLPEVPLKAYAQEQRL